MATIKSLLEKAMLRLGSRGGRSSEEYVFITVDQNITDFQPFTAPTDGTYVAQATATSDDGYIWMNDGSGNGWSCRALFNNGALVFSFPIKKGATANIQFVGLKNRSLKFTKSIGGCS